MHGRSSQAEKVPDQPEQFQLNPFTRCIRALQRYSVFSTATVLTISLMSTAANALYSLTFYSDTQPEDISLEWWNSMTDAVRIFSVTNACASIISNMLINAKYLPLAGQKLKKSFKDLTCSKFLENMACLSIALTVGVIYGAQSYDAFKFTYISFSIISGLTNFLVYIARRYNGLVSMLGKIKNLYNEDIKFQQECTRQLKHLNANFASQLTEFNDQPLNEQTVLNYLTAVFEGANDPESAVSRFDEETRSEYWKNKLINLTKFFLAAFCAPPAFMVGEQNSFEGIQILSNGQAGTLPKSINAAIGFLPSFANAVFYFDSGADCVQSVQDGFNNKKYGASILALILNALCATAYYVIAQGTVNDKNVLGIEHNTILGDFLPILFLIAAFITGINNMDIIFGRKNPTIKNVEDVIHWLERNILPKEAIQKLRDKVSATALQHSAVFSIGVKPVECPKSETTEALTTRLLPSNV